MPVRVGAPGWTTTWAVGSDRGPLRPNRRQFPKKLNAPSPYDPAPALPAVYPRDMKCLSAGNPDTDVYKAFIHWSWTVETGCFSPQQRLTGRDPRTVEAAGSRHELCRATGASLRGIVPAREACARRLHVRVRLRNNPEAERCRHREEIRNCQG